MPQFDSGQTDGLLARIGAALGARWVVALAATLLVGVAVWTIVFQFVLSPTLTGTRFDLDLVGHSQSAILEADTRAGIARVTTSSGLEFVLSDERLWLRASALGLTEADDPWLEFPRDVILGRLSVEIDIDAVFSELTLGPKECRGRASLTDTLIDVLFPDETSQITYVCGAAVGGPAFEWNLRVRTTRVAPSRIALGPEDPVMIIDPNDPTLAPIVDAARVLFATG